MKINEKGMTLVEVLVSLLLVSVIIFAAVAFMSSAYRSTSHNQEKEFAVQKSMSILDEMKALVENSQGGVILDNYDESGGPPTNPLLTILTDTDEDGQPDLTAADADYPTSGNTKLGSRWLYLRQITVAPIGSDENRLVNVKLFKTDSNGGYTLLSEVAGVLRTIAPAFSPTQVYDVYLLAIDNVPGWWVYMSNIIPFVQSTLQDLSTRNPGLEFRTHWITKLAYGRNYMYKPFFNSNVPSTNDINFVYFYPGALPANNPVSFYYQPSRIAARINIDGATTNDYDATTNPFPYALADNYNNAMRYPDEKALFDARVNAGLEDPEAPTYRLLLEDMYQNPAKFRNAIFINLHGELFPFPPIRNYSDPAKDPETFTNVTQGFPRAVTHPENLHYDNNQVVKLRVYSFLNNNYNPPVTTPMQFLNVPIKVRIKNVNWTPAAGEVQVMIGGTDQLPQNAILDAYSLINAPTAAAGVSPYFTSAISGSDTVLSLYNSPLVTTPVAGAGLAPAQRLYGMDYIPSPQEDFIPPANPNGQAFLVNLANATANRPKNTARWILSIPDSALTDDSMITIETRINSDTSGVPFPADHPDNLSRTYVWRGSDTWLFGNRDITSVNTPHLPITERYQVIGDPRHLPYADLKRVYSNPVHPLGTGFNRYFDDFQNAAGNLGDANVVTDWIGWENKPAALPPIMMGIKNDGSQGNDGWDVTEPGDPGPQGMLEVDVNRIFQIFRTILLRTHSAYTTLSGFSYCYLGLGGEIGYDGANGFPNGIPVSDKPFSGTGGTHNENSIFSPPNIPNDPTFHFKYIRRQSVSNWFARYWIGELYPDDVWSTQWNANGNLNTGTLSTNFARVPRSLILDGVCCNQTDLLPTGTTLVPTGRSTEEEGSTAFFNIGDSNAQFHHQWSTGNGLNDMADPNADGDTSDGTTGNLQADGTEISTAYHLPVPGNTRISRPFRLNANFEGRAPDNFDTSAQGVYNTNYAVAGVPAYGVNPTGTLSSTFYDHEYAGAYVGSGLITLRETVAGTDTGASYISMNGIDKTGESGTVFIGRWSMLTLVHGFLTGGLGNSAARIRELPRIFISPFADADLASTNDLDVEWNMTWTRWDGEKYTNAYANNFEEDTNTSHVLLFTKVTSSGFTWKYAADNTTAATLGTRLAPGSPMWTVENVQPNASMPLSYGWGGSGSFTEGGYLLRMEAFRDDLPLHYSYHQRRIYLKR